MSFFSFISFSSYNGLRQEFLETCCVNMILLKDNSRAQTLNACFTSGFRVKRHVLLTIYGFSFNSIFAGVPQL